MYVYMVVICSHIKRSRSTKLYCVSAPKTLLEAGALRYCSMPLAGNSGKWVLLCSVTYLSPTFHLVSMSDLSTGNSKSM